MNQPVLSRHRLPRTYRLSLTGLWLAPTALFLITFIIAGLERAGFDLSLLLPLVMMAVPALYVWHEGIDVLPGGLRLGPTQSSRSRPPATLSDPRRGWENTSTVWRQARRTGACNA